MVAHDPAQPNLGSSADHCEQPLAVALVRLCWPLPGALAGAALAFRLYFRQPGLNTDSAAPLFFASSWALAGLLAGMVCSSVAAWLIERGLRRCLSTKPLITTSLTLLWLIGLCYLLQAPLEARLPALFWPSAQNLPARQHPGSPPSACTQAPPAELQARQSWDLECR